MLLIIGAVVVLGCVIVGFLMGGGNLLLLWHPTEVIIICGARSAPSSSAIRSRSSRRRSRAMLVAAQGAALQARRLRRLCSSCCTTFCVKIRKEGMLGDRGATSSAPAESALFKKYPRILADHHMMEFITDCLRLMVGGNLDPHELESLLEYELETHHNEAHEPAHAVQKVADALPGFGIVAAVLGIVSTMASIDGADTAHHRAQGGRGAGRHLPRHPGGLRLRRPDRRGHGAAGAARRARRSSW